MITVNCITCKDVLFCLVWNATLRISQNHTLYISLTKMVNIMCHHLSTTCKFTSTHYYSSQLKQQLSCFSILFSLIPNYHNYNMKVPTPWHQAIIYITYPKPYSTLHRHKPSISTFQTLQPKRPSERRGKPLETCTARLTTIGPASPIAGLSAFLPAHLWILVSAVTFAAIIWVHQTEIVEASIVERTRIDEVAVCEWSYFGESGKVLRSGHLI